MVAVPRSTFIGSQVIACMVFLTGFIQGLAESSPVRAGISALCLLVTMLEFKYARKDFNVTVKVVKE